MVGVTVSIVIAAVNDWDSLEECLGCLSPQLANRPEAELLIMDRCHDGWTEKIAAMCPEARVFVYNEKLNIPYLRAMGIEKALGEWVVIIEDHCMVENDWLENIIRTTREAAACGVIGGAVTNGSCERLVDWAAFLCEYSFSMPPLVRGEVDGVTGNNVCYRRSVLMDHVAPDFLKNRWEFFWHKILRQEGVRFFCAPEILVRHKKRFPFWYFIQQRFYYSRSFAAMRAGDMTKLRHLIYAAASPLLVPLMLWRTFREVAHKRRHEREFLLSLPVLFFFLLSYAAGEAVGYLSGAGNSLEEVE
jgi:glycosyltransferase involved in cell wall biosynthesis